jgi:hypothetical protein
MPTNTLRGERGSTLLEAVVALSILMVTLLGLAQAFVLAMAHVATAEANLIAREKAREAVESVHTARDTQVITWAQIRNVSNGGVFLDGPQQLKRPGADGLINTGDDTIQLETIPQSGPTGAIINVPLTNYTRQVLIEDIAGSPALRRLTVTIRFQNGSELPVTYRLVTFVSAYA